MAETPPTSVVAAVAIAEHDPWRAWETAGGDPAGLPPNGGDIGIDLRQFFYAWAERNPEQAVRFLDEELGGKGSSTWDMLAAAVMDRAPDLGFRMLESVDENRQVDVLMRFITSGIYERFEPYDWPVRGYRIQFDHGPVQSSILERLDRLGMGAENDRKVRQALAIPGR